MIAETANFEQQLQEELRARNERMEAHKKMTNEERAALIAFEKKVIEIAKAETRPALKPGQTSVPDRVNFTTDYLNSIRARLRKGEQPAAIKEQPKPTKKK